MVHGSSVVLCKQCDLWSSDPSEWDDIAHEVEGVMLFKKGDRSNPSNYRCVQLIDVISRLLAKVVDRRVQKFAEQRGLLPTEQCGF